MEKLDLTTPNFTDENIAKLAELFPNCVTETKSDDGEVKHAIDFDALRQEFSETIVEGPVERYSLNWPGKREALVTANTPISKTLRPCREESVEFDTTKNIFIEGDNLDALKLLQESYLGKVKMIYIDPPYNTGSDFVYNDSFKVDKSEFDVASGQKDEEGGRLVANTDGNGRFHSDWLSMMYPRLKLSRNLMRDDGIIFISIDDNEQENLKKLCDEVFGRDNFVANVAWQKRTSPDMRKAFSTGHEYVLIYIKKHENENSALNLLALSEDQIKRYKNPDNDPLGKWVSSDFTAQGFRPNQMYTIETPNGATYEPPEGRCWKNVEPAFLQQVSEGRFWFGADGGGVPRRKNYLNETKGRVPWSWWPNNEVGHNQEAKKEVNQLFETAEVFPTPKPVRLIKRMLEISTNNNDIVLDFFAGSGASAHASMQINCEDNGERRFIMVQLPEICDEKSIPYKAGYENIAEISKERIRRAGQRIKDELAEKEKAATASLFDGAEEEKPKNLDIGFRVFKIDSSNMQDVHLSPDETRPDMLSALEGNIKADRTGEDLLFQVLLDWGVDLSLPIESQTIDNKTVYFVDGNALAACFDEGINEEFVKTLADKKPLRVVFRDDGFASDSVKINVEQIFKLKSPSTDIRVI